MLTQSRSRNRNRSLSIENLESRLNLSTLGTTALFPKAQNASLSRSGQRITYKAHRLNATKLSSIVPLTSHKTHSVKSSLSLSQNAATPAFGDTNVSSTGTTDLDVSAPSYIANAQVEWVNGKPDVGFMSKTSQVDVQYKVNVAAAGTYQLNVGVASPSWGSYNLLVNGSTQAQNSFNATGTWQTYANTTQTITLAAGTNTIAVDPTWNTQFNIGALSLTPVNAGGPTTTVGSSTASVPVSNYSAISNCQLENNGQPDIGWVSTSGAYVEYKLNVQTAGNYSIGVKTASQNNAQFNLSVNGTQAATYNAPGTGSWSNYSANTANSVYLPAGTVTIRLASANGTQYNIGGVSISPTSATTSNTTTPTATTTSSAATNIGSSAASVPVSSYSSIYNCQLENNGQPDIGYVSTSGSYVEYKLNVQTAGNYSIGVKTASQNNAQFNLSVNGTQAATYNAPGTGSWSNYSANTANSVYLPAGTVTIRFTSANGTQYNIGGITVSPASSTTTSSTTTPAPTPAPTTTTTTPTTNTSNGAGFDASVSTQWMTSFNQLNIVAGSQNDSVYVTQSGSTIYVNVNGVTNAYNGSFGDIVVKAGSGSDNITIDGSVSADALLYGGSGNDTLKNFTSGHATIVSIGGGYDTLQGNGKNTQYWADSSDSINASGSESWAGNVHSVSGFWGGVSTSLNGQNLSDPNGTGATTRVSNASLWGTGPTMADVNQGQVPDCFLLAAGQTLAYSNPEKLRTLAVDLGDGTYAVQFKSGGTTNYVRVDGDLPANGPYANGLEYAHPGASGDLWAPILEKAYAQYAGGNSYSGLDTGYFGTVYSNFGIGYSSLSASNAGNMFNNIVNALNNGKGVTIGTNTSISGGAPLIGFHTYNVTAAWTDGSGTQWVTVRNPWGFDGVGSDSNTSDGLTTMTIGQLAQNTQAATILA